MWMTLGQDLLGVARGWVRNGHDLLGVEREWMKMSGDLLGVAAIWSQMPPVRVHLAQDLLGVVQRWVAFPRTWVQVPAPCTALAACMDHEVAQYQWIP